MLLVAKIFKGEYLLEALMRFGWWIEEKSLEQCISEEDMGAFESKDAKRSAHGLAIIVDDYKKRFFDIFDMKEAQKIEVREFLLEKFEGEIFSYLKTTLRNLYNKEGAFSEFARWVGGYVDRIPFLNFEYPPYTPWESRPMPTWQKYGMIIASTLVGGYSGLAFGVSSGAPPHLFFSILTGLGGGTLIGIGANFVRNKWMNKKDSKGYNRAYIKQVEAFFEKKYESSLGSNVIKGKKK